MDKLREKFEETIDHQELGFNPDGFNKRKDGSYYNYHIDNRWQGWKDCYQALQEPTQDMIVSGMEVIEPYLDWPEYPDKVRKEIVLGIFKAMLAEFGGSDAN